MVSTDKPMKKQDAAFFSGRKIQNYIWSRTVCAIDENLSETDTICLELQDVSRQQVTLHVPFSTQLLIEGITVCLHPNKTKDKYLRLKLLQKFFANCIKPSSGDRERALLWSTNIQKVFFSSSASLCLGFWLCWIY